MIPPNGLSFAELLAYNDLESRRWKDWFLAHPEAMDQPTDIAKSDSVRALLVHIFIVELFFSSKLLDLPPLDFEAIRPSTVADVFAVHEDAHARFEQFLAKGADADWDTICDLRTNSIRGSKRKLMSQAMLHSIQHRAQLASLMRQQGWEGLWVHDLILTDVME